MKNIGSLSPTIVEGKERKKEIWEAPFSVFYFVREHKHITTQTQMRTSSGGQRDGLQEGEISHQAGKETGGFAFALFSVVCFALRYLVFSFFFFVLAFGRSGVYWVPIPINPRLWPPENVRICLVRCYVVVFPYKIKTSRKSSSLISFLSLFSFHNRGAKRAKYLAWRSVLFFLASSHRCSLENLGCFNRHKENK